MSEHVCTEDCQGYSRHYRAFVHVPWHLEAFEAAYLNPDVQAARNELERLQREFATLPPRHVCTCRCPQERPGWPPCGECKRLRESQRKLEPVEIGRHGPPAHAPVPLVLMLDVGAGFVR